jgi:hypothetical protein
VGVTSIDWHGVRSGRKGGRKIVSENGSYHGQQEKQSCNWFSKHMPTLSLSGSIMNPSYTLERIEASTCVLSFVDYRGDAHYVLPGPYFG